LHQRPQPGLVGADDIGQDEGVEAVVLVPGRPVAAAEVDQLAGWDDVDSQASGQQRLHDRPVGSFDADRADAGLAQAGRTSVRSPAAVWAMLNRWSCWPLASTTLTAWSAVAQSIPPTGRAPVAGSVTLMVASSLLAQWEGTRWSRDTTAGRSLIGALWRTALLSGVKC
jgi:hypothetical protein